MAKQRSGTDKLRASIKAQEKVVATRRRIGDSRFDRAEEVLSPKASNGKPMSRSTDRMSISMLTEERNALQARSDELRLKGHRDLKPSRLARVAFQMLLEASDEEILTAADEVPNLERRRVAWRDEEGR